MPSGAKEAPRCLIVDDHPVVRAGVRAVLEQAFGRSAVDDAASLDEATADVNGGDPPEVVIVDPWRVGSDGGARLLSEALKAGVKGYVRKDSPSEDLIRAIEAARAGEFYVDPGLSST